jgi:hypothetical protein
MHNSSERTARGRRWIRSLARIWSSPIIIYSLIMFVGYSWNWVTTGIADPYSVEDIPFIEALLPFMMFFSVIGLGIAWRWERLGGMLALGFQLTTLILLIFQRPSGKDFPRSTIPYLLSVVIIIPGILFLFSWWKSRGTAILPTNA